LVIPYPSIWSKFRHYDGISGASQLIVGFSPAFATVTLVRNWWRKDKRMKHAPLLNFADRRDPAAFADAADVSRKLAPDFPVFCFSPASLLERTALFFENFPGEVAYAVKANPEPHVLSVLAEAGCKVWDVASIEEISAVRAVSPAAEFHYHNPVKSRLEIRESYVRYGCRRFAVDCFEELDKISDVLGKGRDLEIAVRFALPRKTGAAAHDFSTKFGASELPAASLLREAAARGYGTALTFHPGSQCTEPAAYQRHIEAAHRIATTAQVELGVLNVGGGFPAAYPASPAPPLQDYFTVIGATAERLFGPSRIKLECEPGRGLVACSHSLLARIKLVRNESELFLNDGIYGALLECAQVPKLMPTVRAIRAGRMVEGASRGYTIYGPTCDPLDVLPGRIELPAGLSEGDFLEFSPVGAYGSATATRFNGYGTRDVVHVA